ncbi:hypothetical protein CRUP_027508, partial [Coryphaenoides rupestris]
MWLGNRYQPVVDYIDRQFESYLQEELKIKRSLHSYHDSRVHACLYFISPTGHSLKSLDLVTMKKLDSKVNIIPVIAKADTISKSELHKFKIKIMSELVSNGVQIYQFPLDDETVAKVNTAMNVNIIPVIAKADTISKSELHKFKIKIMSELVSNGVQIYQFPLDDETVAKVNTAMNGLLPFAVVGSTEEVSVGNKMVKARQYPWGVVQGERGREEVSTAFLTHTRHYELYRRCKLEEMGFKDTDPESKPI